MPEKMTVIIDLKCDSLNCRRTASAIDQFNGVTIHQARKNAERGGWSFKKTKTSCPDCSARQFREEVDQLKAKARNRGSKPD